MDDLLNTHSFEPNPYESVSPSALVFSTTQCSADAPSKDESRRSRWKWSPTEDLLLINAWRNTNKDPKFPAFWRGVSSYYNSNPKLSGLQKREPTHCRQRWRKISDPVQKFVRCYEAATTQISTGQSESDDVVQLANQIYLNDHKVRFTMEHGWRELRHDRKWFASLSANKTLMSKRRKFEEGSGQSSNSHPVLSHGEDHDDDDDDDAMAVKVSKAKPKRNVEGEDKSELDFERMWEMKQKDFAFEEKLSKHKLLDTLLTKTEPLSEMEMALKNKLINDMLSS